MSNFSTTALMEKCVNLLCIQQILMYNPFCTRISNSLRAETYKNNSFYTKQREKGTEKGTKKQDKKIIEKQCFKGQL